MNAAWSRALVRAFKEPVNALTHLAGAVLAVGATVALAVLARGDAMAVAAFLVFGATSVLLFTASTLLHAVRAGPGAERWLRRFDHGAIYLLIAGSYTPITLVALQPQRATLGWWLFALVWLCAVGGLVFKTFWLNAPRWLSTALYLAMGWLVVLAIVPVARSLGTANTVWLGLGGLFYSVGAVIYALKRPRLWPGVFGFHELWHLFVLAGWGCHLVMMVRLGVGV
ncbi:MAG: hemolysin III family protein [Trueperaceae bacterium]|nr:hemolysin III family protein [Trueperaceae bacterium]MCO5174316.1 hemolysin III family protein [Trueperaceae bacterium]MCW5820420.1 hemolysin III family protein [Trueperaceae bacterium]